VDLNFIHRDFDSRLRPRQVLVAAAKCVGWKARFMRATRWMWIVLCAMSLCVSAQEGSEGGTAATIRALEHQWVDGQSRNNNAALNLIFDNSLVYVEYGKLVSKGEYLLRIKAAGPQISQIVMEPMTVRTFGSTAIVVGTYREKDVTGGKPGVRRWRFVDTWMYKNGGGVRVGAGAAPLTAE